MTSTLNIEPVNSRLMRMPCQRPPDENVEICDCYHVGINLSDLLCKGCKYCQRIHKQWAKFEDDVDDVVPLAVRCIEPQSDTNGNSSIAFQ